MIDKSMIERAKEPQFMQRELTCHDCGMLLDHPAEYHTFVHCELMKQCRNGSTVKDNIEYTVENHPKFKVLTAERDKLIRKNAVLMAAVGDFLEKFGTNSQWAKEHRDAKPITRRDVKAMRAAIEECK